MEPIRNTDDPRLTAYALGELDPSETQLVEAFLAHSAEARATVEEIRSVGQLLSHELAGEEAPGLEARHHAAIATALEHPPRRGLAPVLRLWAPMAAAAVAVVALSWQFGLRDVFIGDQLAPNGGAVAQRVDNAAKSDEPFNYDTFGQPSRRLTPEAALDGSQPAGRPDAAAHRSSGAVANAPPLVEEQLERLRERVNVYSRADVDALSSSLGRQEGAAPAPSTLPSQEHAGGKAGDDALAGARGVAREAAQYEAEEGVHAPGGFAGTLLDDGPVQQIEQKIEPNLGDEALSADHAKVALLEDRKKERQVQLDPQPVMPADDALGVIGLGRGSAEGAAGVPGPASASTPAPVVPALTTPATTAPIAGGGAARSRAIAAAGEAEPEGFAHKLKALGYLDVDSDDRGSFRYELPKNRPGNESYAPIIENPFVPLTADPLSALSTFGIDVDTASYANVRRFLNRGQTPPPDAVRLEELINYFDYDYAGPQGEHPFAVHLEVTQAPWAPRHRLVRIGLKGREVVSEERPPSNFVFLLDVSGSMKSADKLPLLVSSLKLLLRELDGDDRVAIVTYAEGTQLVLPSTPASQAPVIMAALDSLSPGGSTHASAGIQLAYQVAQQDFIEGGVNRVLLATDGDFNVGITGEGQLEGFITEKARGGVFLTVLGFGTGNLKDSKAEILADRGNGNYAYIDSLNEAYKVLVNEMGGTLVTIAKDVKIQVEFNPGRVAAYRLLGYENRALAAADFRNDAKDAGEIGAGHTVTALYEVVPAGLTGLTGTVELKYQQQAIQPQVIADSDELLTVNLRYKQPDGVVASEFSVPLVDGESLFAAASPDFKFAAAVASFGMLLRHSAYQGETSFERIVQMAEAGRGADPHGYRSEFIRLVRMAQGLPGY